MTENWIDELAGDPTMFEPPPGLRVELRDRLSDEWNGRPVAVAVTELDDDVRRPKRGWLMTAAAVMVLLVVGLVVVVRAGDRDGTVVTPGPTDEVENRGVIERGLREIPLVAYDLVAADPLVQITIADFGAVADIRQLSDSVPGRGTNEVLEWFQALSFGIDDDETELTVELPTRPNLVPSLPELLAVLGLDVGAIGRFAEIWGRVDWRVFTGDLEFSATLPRDADGVIRLGAAEEGSIDVDERTDFNPNGRACGSRNATGASRSRASRRSLWRGSPRERHLLTTSASSLWPNRSTSRLPRRTDPRVRLRRRGVRRAGSGSPRPVSASDCAAVQRGRCWDGE